MSIHFLFLSESISGLSPTYIKLIVHSIAAAALISSRSLYCTLRAVAQLQGAYVAY